ncbi:MAG TPA: hypothetical protein VKY19_00785 [Ktedonosporobacter sp.]|nr:hypothetical protein [Ktedonosporobacter sp.]
MYRYRGPHRRMRRLGGFPFVLPFVIFAMSHGSVGALVASFLMITILFLIVRAMMGTFFGPSTTGNYQQPQQYYQPPYQPYQPPYQPYEQTYQPYEQGYQPQPGVSEPYQESERGEQPYQAQTQYEQYEQPQVQYPEQMPPMQ